MNKRDIDRIGCGLSLMLVLLAFTYVAVRIIANVSTKGWPF